jgi:hypothetical protein
MHGGGTQPHGSQCDVHVGTVMFVVRRFTSVVFLMLIQAPKTSTLVSLVGGVILNVWSCYIF